MTTKIELWSDYAGGGWVHAANGRADAAAEAWSLADDLAESYFGSEVRINPKLSLLRFYACEGEIEGTVRSDIPGEDSVVSMRFADWPEEAESDEGMRPSKFITTTCIRKYMEDHTMADLAMLHNTKKELPHLQVLSTGRCGTISMAKLLEKSQYLAYHNCIFNVAASTKFEFMSQLAENHHEPSHGEQAWAATRAAEWIGAVAQDRPAAFCSHLDTIFAPVFAKIHPQSKFIYLHRDPVKIFESFLSKNQWNEHQLQPVLYDFPWRWKRDDFYSYTAKLAWYIKFTETFSRAFGAVMGDRFVEISADKLFDLDADEINKLVLFADLYDSAETMNHFRQPHNAKVHKAGPILKGALDAFRREYEKMC